MFSFSQFDAVFTWFEETLGGVIDGTFRLRFRQSKIFHRNCNWRWCMMTSLCFVSKLMCFHHIPPITRMMRFQSFECAFSNSHCIALSGMEVISSFASYMLLVEAFGPLLWRTCTFQIYYSIQQLRIVSIYHSEMLCSIVTRAHRQLLIFSLTCDDPSRSDWLQHTVKKIRRVERNVMKGKHW